MVSWKTHGSLRSSITCLSSPLSRARTSPFSTVGFDRRGRHTICSHSDIAIYVVQPFTSGSILVGRCGFLSGRFPSVLRLLNIACLCVLDIFICLKQLIFICAVQVSILFLVESLNAIMCKGYISHPLLRLHGSSPCVCQAPSAISRGVALRPSSTYICRPKHG